LGDLFLFSIYFMKSLASPLVLPALVGLCFFSPLTALFYKVIFKIEPLY